MATRQFNVKSLARFLDGVMQPIYLLDDEFSIVYINKSCIDWLGRNAEELPGTICRYHTPVGNASPEMVAAGLCPPPDIANGHDLSATVSYFSKDGRLLERNAKFHPLGFPPGELVGVAAVVDVQDLPEFRNEEPVPRQVEPDGDQLHEAVRSFRRHMAGRFRADRLAGTSPMMQLARRQLELASHSRSSVLLVGPSGSGRQHLATVIHNTGNSDFNELSPAGGLVPLDCSILAPDLVLSTVAALARYGSPNEKNRQMSLLLNHVDEIPADLQTALAIMIAKPGFSLRLISTARMTLSELCDRGQFREDLASLLCTITIFLPPLVERREDMPLLAQIFLEEQNASGTKQLKGMTQESLDLLHSYSWPGNVNELREMIGHAHQKAAGNEIQAADLPERLRLAAHAAAYPRRPEEKIVLDEYMHRVERELIRRAIARSKGNKAKAARLLGLTRPRLYRRMVQLGLDDGGSQGNV
jgi:DNA-binding NtrC family response regulator